MMKESNKGRERRRRRKGGRNENDYGIYLILISTSKWNTVFNLKHKAYKYTKNTTLRWLTLFQVKKRFFFLGRLFLEFSLIGQPLQVWAQPRTSLFKTVTVLVKVPLGPGDYPCVTVLCNILDTYQCEYLQLTFKLVKIKQYRARNNGLYHLSIQKTKVGG